VGVVNGSATRGKTIKPLTRKPPSGGSSEDDDEKKKSTFLDALKNYNSRND
jgi:hypothetical protein